jgi:tetraacyldisaccharide 4'-kinase
LDVVVLSADDPFPGNVLPRGPYRESASALERADAVLITRRTATFQQAGAIAHTVERAWPGRLAGMLALAAGDLVREDGSPGDVPAGDVLAVCAIARAEAFGSAVGRLTGGRVELVSFPDHHRFDRRDVARLRRIAGARPLMVTEKDAVKLVAWRGELGDVLVLRDALRWERGEDEMRDRLLAAVREAEAA